MFMTNVIDTRSFCIEQLANVIKSTIVTKWVHIGLTNIANRNHMLEDTNDESILKIENMLQSLKYFYCNDYDIFDFSQDYYKSERFFDFLGQYHKEFDADYIDWFAVNYLGDKLEINTDQQLWEYLDVRPIDLVNRFFGSNWYEEYLDLWYPELDFEDD